MNKNVIIGAVVILAVGLGYYQFSYVPAQKAAQEAAQQAVAKAAAEAEAAKKAADEAAAKAEAEAKAAEEAAAKAAEDAAAKALAEAEAAATKAAEEAAAALNPATFDLNAVTALIDGSTLDDATKTWLKAAITNAAADPVRLQGALDQVKAALGL